LSGRRPRRPPGAAPGNQGFRVRGRPNRGPGHALAPGEPLISRAFPQTAAIAVS